MEEILFDPQTSGGLLVSMPQADALEALKNVKRSETSCGIVGNDSEKNWKESYC